MKRKKKLPILPREDRTCGGCNACCSVLAISALKKKAGADCVHLDRTKLEHHCSIYETRPVDCSEYQCGWVRSTGFGGDEDRPDKIGVLFTPRDNKEEVESFAGPYTLVAHETREGSFEEPEAKAFMHRLAGHFIVLGFYGPTLAKCRTMGPAHKLKRVFEWCETHGYGGRIHSILRDAVPSFEDYSRRLL